MILIEKSVNDLTGNDDNFLFKFYDQFLKINYNFLNDCQLSQCTIVISGQGPFVQRDVVLKNY